MNKCSNTLAIWNLELREIYEAREIKSIFKITCEDLLNKKLSDFDLKSDAVFSESEILILKNALSRLKTGEPLQYIVGFTYFADLKINVSPAVLIPRPETEELVYWIAESFDSKTSPSKILDWCTGSGCIALALKKLIPNSEIIAYDISNEALEIAKTNAKINQLTISFEEKDALNFIENTSEFDVIVSNPPYIPFANKKEMHQNVLNYEPGLALFVMDENPLLFYKAISTYALAHLKVGGHLFFEIHEAYSKEIEVLLHNLSFQEIELKIDLQGKARMIKAKKGPKPL